jgi:hypothetical protein
VRADAAALAALAGKYGAMAELRRLLAPHAGGEPSQANLTRMRELARAFPGALRELDTLPTDEIDRRRAALEAAAEGAQPPEPWMDWMHAYHALMRVALALKRRRGAPLSDEERTRLAAANGVPVDAALERAVAAPPHGRLNAVVFARLSVEFGLPAAALWDALYPPRKGERPYRRH